MYRISISMTVMQISITKWQIAIYKKSHVSENELTQFLWVKEMITWEIMKYSHCTYSTDYVFPQKYCMMEFLTIKEKNRTQVKMGKGLW